MPPMMQNHLSRFEDRIQRFIEGGLARLLAGHLHPREVAIQLARAMEDHVREQDGQRIAPDLYIVRLNPQDHSAILAAQPDIAAQMANELTEMARTGGLTLLRTPELRLLADQQIAPHEVSVSAQHSNPRPDSTQAMKVPLTPEDVSRPHGMLILSDSRHVPLTQPIITLGRARHCDIVIDDPHVSRRHAQIRWRSGECVLVDLGSTGGTAVNGQRVQEAVLRSGDVIELAGYSLIYVEGETSAPATEDPPTGTRPYPPLER